jgi:biotin operon repressor
MEATPVDRFWIHHEAFAEFTRAWDERRAFWFWGGRGMGKTALLQRLHETLEQQELGGARLIRGRAPGGRAEFLEVIGRVGQSGAAEAVILVDDYDFILDVETNRALRVLLASHARPGRLALTARLSLSRMIAEATVANSPLSNSLSEVWECFAHHGHVSSLNPWEYPAWQERFREYLGNRIYGVADGNRVMDAWAKTVLGVTGGHPALLGSALNVLERLVDEQGQPRQDLPAAYASLFDDQTPRLAEAIESALMGELMHSGMPTVNRAIQQLREDAPTCYEYLVGLAGGPTEPAAPGAYDDSVAEAMNRERAKEAGLAYEDFRDGTLRLPGKLIENAIRSSAGAGRIAIRSTELQVIDAAHQRGALIAHCAGRTLEVPLSGRALQVIGILKEREPAVVSLEDLRVALGVDDLTAVRSAIERTVAALRKHGLEALIENVRGSGYRLGRAASCIGPTWPR